LCSIFSPESPGVKRLCVDLGRLSRWLLAAIWVIVLVPAPTVWAYAHHNSSVRFLDLSPATFEIARREGKPVFLLISAVWCYWCKYFDQNTLKNDEVSKYLNRHYVSIFVDHDRRVDLVRKYVRGLPMIVLFDPDGRVRQSFAGALKSEDFLGVLKHVASDVRTSVATAQPRTPPAGPVIPSSPVPVTPETYRRLREGMLNFVNDHLDTTYGGFGSGDKYPHARLLGYLVGQYDASRDHRYLVAVDKSLDGILSGIYDPVEGGFFRYAEGREWRQPHYEKLLDVNASLVLVLVEAYRVTRTPRYQQAAEATIAYLLRTLHDARAGGFYGSQTADPAYYRLALEERRAARRPPVNRDKVAEWNAQAALVFLAVGQSSGRKDLVDIGLSTLEFMRRNLVSDKGMFHFFDVKTGRGQLRGQLTANGWAALAFLEGYRVSRLDIYRRAAERVLGYARDELFDTAHGAFVDDKTTPLSLGANGIMAEALIQAHRLTGRTDDLAVATRVLAALGGVARSLLVEDADATAVTRAAEAVFFLNAYRQVVEKP